MEAVTLNASVAEYRISLLDDPVYAVDAPFTQATPCRRV